MISLVVVIVTALVFSAFFSGMEIAFVSSNKLKLEIEKKRSRTYGHIIDVFLKKPGQYITTILVGNNIALVIYSLFMSKMLNIIAIRFGFTPTQGSIIIETLISTIVIIFTAEFIPKAAFRANPNFFMRILAVPVYIIYLILFPIAKFATWISVGILRMTGLKVGSKHDIKSFDRVDLAHMLEEVSETEAVKTENEIKLFQNALDFSDLRVRDCLVPRVDIEAVDINDTIEDLARRFIETNYSRIFVYEGSIDNIIGYVTTKSLFKNPKTIREVLMEVDYVPEALSAQKLLSLFIKKNRAVAVVIDEFGGTAGIVSMEDVLEEIFGEIEDEHDEPELIAKELGGGVYIFSGRYEVEALNEKYQLGIPESDEYETLAGYIIYSHEGIPSKGEIVVIDGKEFRMLRVAGSKVDLVRVTVL